MVGVTTFTMDDLLEARDIESQQPSTEPKHKHDGAHQPTISPEISSNASTSILTPRSSLCSPSPPPLISKEEKQAIFDEENCPNSTTETFQLQHSSTSDIDIENSRPQPQPSSSSWITFTIYLAASSVLWSTSVALSIIGFVAAGSDWAFPQFLYIWLTAVGLWVWATFTVSVLINSAYGNAKDAVWVLFLIMERILIGFGLVAVAGIYLGDELARKLLFSATLGIASYAGYLQRSLDKVMGCKLSWGGYMDYTVN